MQTNLDRFLACRGILLLVLLSSAGCFSAVKQKDKDAGGPKVDTSALDTSQAGVDALNGSGGTVVIDASGGGVPSSGGVGAGDVLGSGGALSTGGNSGSGGAIVDASTPNVPLVSDGSDAPTTLSNASLCTADTQCTNGHCVDGVCCDGKCDGQCQSCAESGSVGQCVTVKGDPRGKRTACAGTVPCKGQCDGSNASACTYPGSSTTCSQASCAAGILTPASYCDSSGSCPAVKAVPCASNVCTADNKSCASSCAGVACGAGSYCDGTTCVPKKTSGPCASSGECSTGFCADGVCCNTPCTEQCKACSLSGTSGTCTRLSTGAPASGHAVCAGSDTCAGSCNSTSDSCVYPSASQKCGAAATCSTDLTTVSFSACDAKGACVPATQGCGSSSYCSNASCTAKLNSGSCSNNVQCSSGNCTGGICCPANQTGCNGTCVDLKTNGSYCGSCTKSCSGLSCCNGSCVDTNTSLSNCGQCGSTCNGSCSGGSCCHGASLSCGSTSTCGAWDFEGNSLQGWRIDSPNGTNAAINVAVSSTRHNGGQYSLAVTVGSGLGPAYVVVPLCLNGSSTNVTGYHITASIFLDGPAWSYPSSQDYSGFFTVASDNTWPSETAPFSQSSNGPLQAGVWVPFDGTFNTAPTLTSISLGFMLVDAPATWYGTMYIDDVVLTAF
jgi:hypothetical protein